MVKTPTPANPVSYEELFVFVQGIARASYTDARMDVANIVDSARALSRRGMSSKPDPLDMKALRRKVAAASDGRPSLSEFASRIMDLHPAVVAAFDSAALRGDEGRETVPIADWGVMLCFGWYSNDVRKHVVEWSYLS